jgi:hypothetical protein
VLFENEQITALSAADAQMETVSGGLFVVYSMNFHTEMEVVLFAVGADF